MSDLSKNGNGVPASARLHHLGGSKKFAIFPLEWIPHIKTFRDMRVFLAVVSHVDANGWCYPSIATLAGYACLTERHVRESLRKLEAIGAIKTEKKPGRLSLYRIAPPPQDEVGPDLGRAPSDEVGPDLGRAPRPDLGRRSNQGSIHERERRARAKASEQAKADEQEAVLTDDEQACFANDLADAAFNATRGFTDEQRRANLARFKTMLTRRDARFGTTG